MVKQLLQSMGLINYKGETTMDNFNQFFDALDLNEMSKWYNEEFGDDFVDPLGGQVHILISEYGQRMMWIDRGAPVLAVAHTDWVADYETPIKLQAERKTFKNWREEEGTEKWVIEGAPHDDRAGMAAFFYVLPELFGLSNFDMLVTWDEEQCHSSAAMFTQEWASEVSGRKVQYNWVMELDRSKDDVVCYQYLNGPKGYGEEFDKAWSEAIKKHFGVIRNGSYTDICELARQDAPPETRLNVKAANFGVGYEKAHSLEAVLFLEMYYDQLKKLTNFYEEFSNTLFGHANYWVEIKWTEPPTKGA